jgi:hypothetical protein
MNAYGKVKWFQSCLISGDSSILNLSALMIKLLLISSRLSLAVRHHLSMCNEENVNVPIITN